VAQADESFWLSQRVGFEATATFLSIKDEGRERSNCSLRRVLAANQMGAMELGYTVSFGDGHEGTHLDSDLRNSVALNSACYQDVKLISHVSPSCFHQSGSPNAKDDTLLALIGRGSLKKKVWLAIWTTNTRALVLTCNVH